MVDILRYKNEGNKHFVDRRYGNAIEMYSLGLGIDPSNLDLLANRAAAYIELRCFIRALEDIKKVLELQPNHVKGVYRMVKSLWGLKMYEEAKEFLKTKVTAKDGNGSEELKKNIDVMQLLDKTDSFIKQHTKGVYDMTEFLKNSKRKTFKHGSKYVAEFRGPVEIQQVEGKDRGLVATQDIKAGQVVICCKPFSISLEDAKLDEKDLDMVSGSLKVDNKTLDNPGRESLAQLIAQKIRLQPESREELFDLFAGPELKWETPMDSDSKKNVAEVTEDEMKRIREIITYNAFSLSRKEIDSEELVTTFQTLPDISLTSTTITGLWLLPSYINHSCVEDNTIWEIFDDVVQVRAFKDIKKGEEILMSYMPPGCSLEERQDTLRSYKFNCNCTLCVLEMNESRDIVQKRKTILDRLLKELENVTKTDFTNLNIHLVLTAVDELEGLQSTVPKLNRCLVNPSLSTLVEIMCHNGRSLNNILTLLDKIHFICTDSGLAINACDIAISSLEVQFGIFTEFAMLEMSARLKRKNKGIPNSNVGNVNGGLQHIQQLRQDIEKRIEVLKHDLIVAYGSFDVMKVIGTNALEMLDTYGYNLFRSTV